MSTLSKIEPDSSYRCLNCRVLVLDDECSVDLVEAAAPKEGQRSAMPALKLLEWEHMFRPSYSRVMGYSGWHRLTARMGY